MSDRTIRTAKHVTITEAHPCHRYVSDDRPAGTAIVERAYDPRCREERVAIQRSSEEQRLRALDAEDFLGPAGFSGLRPPRSRRSPFVSAACVMLLRWRR